MKTKILFLATLIALTVVALRRVHGDAPAAPGIVVAATQEPGVAPMRAPLPSPIVAAQQAEPVASASMLPAVPELSQADIEKEFAQKDSPPAAVLNWTTDVGRAMVESLDDPQKADQTFAFLGECMKNKKSAEVFRAVCAGNAKRLAARYPEKFGNSYKELELGLTEKITAFLADSRSAFPAD